MLREEHIDKFKQFLWRPRPVTMLSREAQKQIRRNLREYSRDFEEEDRIADDKEKGAVVEERRRLLQEWLAWRAETIEEVREEREELGLPEEEDEGSAPAEANGESAKVEEMIVEEVIDEQEEIVS